MLLKLKQEAYENSGELRIIENGKETIYVLNNWYEANAEDKEGNNYTVYWDDSDENCNFEKPCMVINLESGKDVNANDCVVIDVNGDWE